MATGQDVAALAASYIGYRIDREGTPPEDVQPWQKPFSCADFTSDILTKAGEPEWNSTNGPKPQKNAFVEAGRFDTTPTVGAVAFYDLMGNAGKDNEYITHCGIVYSISDDGIVDVENNAIDSNMVNEVAFHKRGLVGDGVTVGFGHPDYNDVAQPAPLPAPAVVHDPDPTEDNFIMNLPVLVLTDPYTESPQVRMCQALLGAANPDLLNNDWCDGVYGPQTEAAVRDFQGSHNCTVDGDVGPQTWSALLGV
jgi:hypothetical protein